MNKQGTLQNNGKVLYDPKKLDSTQSFDTTSEQLKTSIVKYKEKIEDTRGEILKTMKTSIEVSNHAGNELNDQTDSMNRTNKQLDIMEEKIDLSNRLVKTLSSWFSVFKKTPVANTTSTKLESESVIKTRFQQQNTEIKDDIYDKKNKDVTKYETEEEKLQAEERREKSKEDEFYDQLFKGIDVLDKNSKTINKILIEHKEQATVIESKIDKSDATIRKNTNKLVKC